MKLHPYDDECKGDNLGPSEAVLIRPFTICSGDVCHDTFGMQAYLEATFHILNCSSLRFLFRTFQRLIKLHNYKRWICACFKMTCSDKK